MYFYAKVVYENFKNMTDPFIFHWDSKTNTQLIKKREKIFWQKQWLTSLYTKNILQTWLVFHHGEIGRRKWRSSNYFEIYKQHPIRDIYSGTDLGHEGMSISRTTFIKRQITRHVHVQENMYMPCFLTLSLVTSIYYHKMFISSHYIVGKLS